MALITEEQVELQTVEWFKELGYQYKHGRDISPEGTVPERDQFRTVVLEQRLHSALTRINPDIPPQTIASAIPQIINPNTPGLLARNRETHRWITQGLKVTFNEGDHEIGRQLKLIDFDNPDNNDWLVVNQFAVNGPRRNRRADLVVFINGLPLAVIELKNPADKQTDIWVAYDQLQEYKDDIPDLFNANALLVISDGLQARMGSLTAASARFMRWRTIDGETLDPLGENHDLETLVRGLFNKETLLNYIRHFCVFEDDGAVVKKIAAYHQYHAVNKALENLVEASQSGGDRRGGVVWHTQGAGKSLEMTYLTARLLTDPRLANPTIVMVTDRQDLDGQLFGVFNDAGDLLLETPKQADTVAQLRELLADRPSGGIIFTTIQKFQLDRDKDEERYPTLTERSNVVVMCDEAHRSQYGFKGKLDEKTGKIKYGLARSLRNALPNATFLAFTGTPISHNDRDTQAVFGEYVDIYDIQQSVQDGATVPIYYESRLSRIELDKSKIPTIDDDVNEIFEESGDYEQQERAKARWSRTEALVGAQPRLKQIAQDMVEHFERRSETQPGKAMIVGMSRDICVRLYDELIAIRPEWHNPDHTKGVLKVVITTAVGDLPHFKPHQTSDRQRRDIEKRFKDPHDELRIVIVRNMWLTGFDVPCLATMYIDKPMHGADLAQAIARVNRVFADKPGGLIVDYIGIAPQLKEALATYSASKGRGRPTIDAVEALNILLEKLAVAKDLLHPIDWSNYRNDALQLLPQCVNHILGIKDGRQRYSDIVVAMTKAFALCGAMDEALQHAGEVAFHQAVMAPLTKTSNGTTRKASRDAEFELKQLVSDALVPDGIADVFKLAGLDKPNIDILSEEFLAEVQRMPHRNLAAELLERLIEDEVHARFRTNIVKQSKFSELLQNALVKYQNRSIQAAQVIIELVEIARELKRDQQKAAQRDLNEEEQAFYDALANNKSAEELMGEAVLIEMAREIAQRLRGNVTIDWSVRGSVRAGLRLIVKSLLRKYRYPPDHQKAATELIMSQAKVVSEELVQESINRS